MIVGVTGRIGAGKDTVGAMLVEHYAFTRFAFADKLKEFARYLGWNGRKDKRGRTLLQNLGEGARQIIGENVWIDVLERAITDANLDVHRANIVITDVRHPNEAQWIRDHGGYVIKVERPQVRRRGAVHQHISETNIDQIVPDIILDNDRSLADLARKVDLAMALLSYSASVVFRERSIEESNRV